MFEIKIRPEDIFINGKCLIFEKNKTAISRWIEDMDKSPLFNQIQELTTFFDNSIIIDGDLELC